jgi:hypothetical protein
MTTNSPLKTPGRPTSSGLAVDKNWWELKVAAVYQEEWTRQWALHRCLELMAAMNQGHLSMDVWRIGNLVHPPVLSQALQAALAADVIVVALQAAVELPAPVARWAEAWAARRPLAEGVVFALVGTQRYNEIASRRTHYALENLARRGGLAYVPQDREWRAQLSANGESNVHGQPSLAARRGGARWAATLNG